MRTERRKSPRFTINQMIDLEMGRENYIAAEGVNISDEGLLCHTSESLEPYSRVYMQLSLNGEKKNHTIKCEGVVVRCKKNKKSYDTALEFADIGESDKKKIHTFLH
jgi:c-di-GMP-binding flagellar brake protein YcgR